MIIINSSMWAEIFVQYNFALILLNLHILLYIYANPSLKVFNVQHGKDIQVLICNELDHFLICIKGEEISLFYRSP